MLEPDDNFAINFAWRTLLPPFHVFTAHASKNATAFVDRSGRSGIQSVQTRDIHQPGSTRKADSRGEKSAMTAFEPQEHALLPSSLPITA